MENKEINLKEALEDSEWRSIISKKSILCKYINRYESAVFELSVEATCKDYICIKFLSSTGNNFIMDAGQDTLWISKKTAEYFDIIGVPEILTNKNDESILFG